MKISQILSENEKKFDEKFIILNSGQLLLKNDFVISEEGYKTTFPKNPIQQLGSFLYSAQITLIKGVIEEIEGMKKEQLDKSNPDNYEACYAIAGHNDSLQKVIDYLKEGIKI